GTWKPGRGATGSSADGPDELPRLDVESDPKKVAETLMEIEGSRDGRLRQVGWNSSSAAPPADRAVLNARDSLFAAASARLYPASLRDQHVRKVFELSVGEARCARLLFEVQHLLQAAAPARLQRSEVLVANDEISWVDADRFVEHPSCEIVTTCHRVQHRDGDYRVIGEQRLFRQGE